MLPDCQVAVYLIHQISVVDTGMFLRAHWVFKKTAGSNASNACQIILIGENIYPHISFRQGRIGGSLNLPSLLTGQRAL